VQSAPCWQTWPGAGRGRLQREEQNLPASVSRGVCSQGESWAMTKAMLGPESMQPNSTLWDSSTLLLPPSSLNQTSSKYLRVPEDSR
jgi:hypothetical protein